MGVYYYFYNDTREEANEKIIPGFGCKFVAKLDSLDDIELIFEEVIRINEWSSTDRISASPDNGDDSIIYINGTVYWYLEDDV